MLFGTLIADSLREERQVQVLDQICELSLRIHSENGEARVVFFVVDGNGKWDLNGSHWVGLWNLSEIDFQIDESLVTSLEDILYIFGPFNKLFECGEGLIDLMFIKFDELDSFLFFLGEQFAAFDDVFIVREVFL